MTSATSQVDAATTARARRMSPTGIGLSLTCLVVFASGFLWMRPEVGGLFVHPYILGVMLLVPATIGSLQRFPRLPLRIGIVLLALMSASLVIEGNFVSEMVKIYTAGLTVVSAALAVKSERDFVVASTALLVAVAIITAAGFLGMADDALESPDGMRFMQELGSKNSFSLFALPVVLLGGYVVAVQKLTIPARVLFIALSLFLVAAVFTTANRSGWLGIVLIGAMLSTLRLNPRVGVFVALGAVVVYLLVARTSTTQMIEHKVDQTREGYSSDTLREDLVKRAFEIGLEHPLFGDGPRQLQFDLAKRVTIDRRFVDTHNLFGYVVGGFGIPAFLALLALGVSLFTMGGRRAPMPKVQRAARDLVRMFVVLWAVRGMFSREILYSPAMCLGIGIAIGHYLQIVNELAVRRATAAAIALKMPKRRALEQLA